MSCVKECLINDNLKNVLSFFELSSDGSLVAFEKFIKAKENFFKIWNKQLRPILEETRK